MKQIVLRDGPRFRRAVLLLLTFGVPVLFLRMTNDPINVPKLVLLMSGVAIVAATRIAELLQGSSARGLRRLALPAAFIAVPLSVAWLVSPYRGWALFGLYDRFQGLIPYLVVIAGGILIADAFAGRATMLAWALVSAGAVVGFYGVLQVLGLDPIVWSQAGGSPGGAASTFGNRNFSGAFLAIVLPVATGLWWTQPDRRRLLLLAAVPLLTGLAVTFSQGAWAAALAGLIIAVGLVVSRRFRPVAAASLIGAGAIVAAVLGQVVLGTIDPGSPLVPGTVLLRAQAWESAVDMFSEDPVLGEGPNAFAVEGTRYRTFEDAVRVGYNYPEDIHSVPLSFATSAGVLGLAGFLLLFAWVVVRARAADRSNVMTVAFLGSIAAYFTQSLVSIDELGLRFSLWAVLAGFVASTEPTEATGPRKRGVSRRRARQEPLRAPAGVAAAAVALAAALWWSTGFLRADVLVWRGVMHAARGEALEARNDFRKALSLRDEYQYRRLYGLRVGALAIAAGPQAQPLLQDARAALSYLDEYPNASRHVERARMLHAAAAIEPTALRQAEGAYRTAMRLDPLNPLIRVELGEVLIDLGRPDAALEILEPMADRVGRAEPSRRVGSEFWGGFALVQAAAGHEDKAITAARRALALSPDEERAMRALAMVGDAD